MLTVIFTVVVALAIGASGQSCSNGQIWNNCGSPCNKTCANYFDIQCPAVCEPRCECPDYKVWHNGTCIWEWNCDTIYTTAEPEPYPETTTMPYKNCSGCLYDTCLDWNNTCKWGCKSGLWGEADPWSWYNNNDCSQECPENCGMDENMQWTRPCNKTSGYCLNGCANGTHGPHCEDICPLGCDWGWGCELFHDDEEIYSCPFNQICREPECGYRCQGQQCVDDGWPWPSSAPILTLSSFVSLAAFLTHMLG